MDEKLRSCPFCASNELRISKAPAIAKDMQTFEMIPNQVQCMNCGAYGPAFAYVEDIIKSWNERIEGMQPKLEGSIIAMKIFEEEKDEVV